MGVAGSSSISWTTFLRSQSPGFCDAFSSEKAFQRFSRAEFSILPGGRGRSAAAGAAVRRRRGPTAAGRRIRGLRRCRGRRVVRCSALRSWLEELRSLPRSSVVARRRARGRARAVYNGAGAAGGGRRGEPPPQRRRPGVSASAPLGSPAGGVRGNSVARDLSQRYVCLANRAAAESARPTPPRRPQLRRRRRRRPPRAPLPPGRAAPARAAGRLAPARLVGPSASVSALAASAPSGPARALGRLALHKLRAKSVSTSARVL